MLPTQRNLVPQDSTGAKLAKLEDNTQVPQGAAGPVPISARNVPNQPTLQVTHSVELRNRRTGRRVIRPVPESRVKDLELFMPSNELPPPQMPEALAAKTNQLITPAEQQQATLSGGLGAFASVSVSVGDGVLRMLPSGPSTDTSLGDRNPRSDISPRHIVVTDGMPSLVTGGMTGVVGEIFTTGSTSVALADVLNPHTTIVQGTMRNTLFTHFSPNDYEQTYYQSGVRVHMRDGLSMTSAMSELNVSAGARGSLRAFSRFLGLRREARLDTLNIDVGTSVDMREVRLWDASPSHPNRAENIAGLLFFGQGVGQAIGAFLGASFTAPSLGATIGGYIGGALTSSAISRYCPPDIIERTSVNPLGANLNLPQISYTARTHVREDWPSPHFVEASVRAGLRYSTERRLPQDLILERRIATEQVFDQTMARQNIDSQTTTDTTPEGATASSSVAIDARVAANLQTVATIRQRMTSIFKKFDDSSPLDSVKPCTSTMQEATQPPSAQVTAVEEHLNDNQAKTYSSINFDDGQPQLRRRRK